jgi:hypothetical protein
MEKDQIIKDHEELLRKEAEEKRIKDVKIQLLNEIFKVGNITFIQQGVSDNQLREILDLKEEITGLLNKK